MKKMIHTILIITIFLLMASVGSAGNQIPALTLKYRSSLSQVDSHLRNKTLLSNSLNQLAETIEQLKKKTSLTVIESYKLKGLLQESSELNKKILSISKIIGELTKETDQSRTAIYQAYQKEIQGLKSKLALTQDISAQKNLYQQITKLTEQAGIYKTSEKGKINIINTKIKPLDGPAEIMEKAYVLKDNEEKLRKRIGQLKTRIQELQDRQKLVNKVTNFNREERIFDEGDMNKKTVRITRLAQKSGNTSKRVVDKKRKTTTPMQSGGVVNPDDSSSESSDYNGAPSESADTQLGNQSGSSSTNPGDRGSSKSGSTQTYTSEIPIRKDFLDPTLISGESHLLKGLDLDQQIEYLSQIKKRLANVAHNLLNRYYLLKQKAKQMQKNEKRGNQP